MQTGYVLNSGGGAFYDGSYTSEKNWPIIVTNGVTNNARDVIFDASRNWTGEKRL